VEVRFRKSGEIEKIALETIRDFITRKINGDLECA